MPRVLVCALLTLLAAGGVRAQGPGSEREAQEINQYILFNEIVRVAPPGHALDVSFGQGNSSLLKPDEIVWLLDPQDSGLTGIASRPIRDTAKAGERLGRIGAEVLRRGAAVHVRAGQEGAYVLDESGKVWYWHGGSADTVRVGHGPTTAADVDVNSSGLVAVLWGGEIAVLLGASGEPVWRFPLEADLLPAVAVAVSAAGEIFVAGRGAVAVAVYDLDPNGVYRRTRAAKATDLGVRAVGGVEVPPPMTLPTEGKEALVDQDRFVYITDADSGVVLVLERTTLAQVGRWEVRGQIPAAAPGRFDVSNRGQIAYVDLRAGEAQVLPTRISVAMIELAPNVRWRILDPSRQVFRVQGGDTLQLPPAPRH